MELTPVTFADLATFPGAAMAAMAVVAFAGALIKGLGAAAKRLTSIVVASGFYVSSVLYATPEISYPVVVVAILSGMLAGMAAAQLYDNLASGFTHKVTKQFDEGYNPGEAGYKPPT